MPTFDEILAQLTDLLQRQGRVSYRALKRRFALDDEYLEDLKAEIIQAQRLAVDEDGAVLVWVGASLVPSSTSQVSGPQALASRPPSPLSYTPPHLAERILAEQAALEARGITDGERKTITALFADIKGSMELIEGLDPEEAQQIIDPALQLMMDAVHRYEGYVVQSTGDGIFALFGAPIAHEDHAQRTLYAALRMQEEMKRYADRLRLQGRRPLEIRVGVNTGEMVLRSIRKDDLHTEYTPISHSTSLAARLQSLATGGGIVVSGDTYRLTDGYFEFKALGAAQVKGVTEPVPLYEVLGVGPLRTRLQVAARRGLVRFVGRQSELEHLKKALVLATAGHGQIVGVMGEPGVGKSRLFYEFKVLSPRGCLVLETFSVSHGRAYAYLPLIDLLHTYFQIIPQDDERRRREKVGGKVLMLDRSLEDTLPYLFALLSISEPNSLLQQMDPQMRKRRTLEAIRRLLVRESLNQPLILIFEDLHWLDAETQAFLSLLSENIATTRILLLVNYRPEYQHSWGNKTFYTQLRLDPLGQVEAEELLTALLGDATALRPVRQFILEKTEGNPFFIEEIVQALREQGIVGRPDVRGAHGFGLVPSPGHAPLLTDLHLPPTVQGVLAARIDRLPAKEKELLQALAVIGKEFPLGLLKRVVDKPEVEVQGLLAHLQEAEFVYEQPAFPEVEYTFKHALTQEVAYQSMLIERRKELHERTAQAIEALFHSRLEDHYNDLAHHYTRSGNGQKAVEYLRLAGQQAVQRSANVEAVSHFTAALELLKTLPDTPAHLQQELALHVALGPPLQATKGFAAPDVGSIYARARELCRQVGESPQLGRVLWGLWQFYFARADTKTARELGEQFLSLAQHLQDPVLLVTAHRSLGTALLACGEFAPARTLLEQGVALYDPRQHGTFLSSYGVDIGVMCLSSAAQALWYLGYMDQAVKKSREALTLARELSHPFSLATALMFASQSEVRRREYQTTREGVEALLALCSEQGFSLWSAWGTALRGWVLARQGREEEGITLICQGLAAVRATGAAAGVPTFLAYLAETYGQVGRPEEGLSTLAEALALVHQNGDRMHEAELYRLKGELTLQSKVSGPKFKVAQEAERCFLQALEIARRQSAKSLELRAVMSLSRLWQQQDKRDEARQMLAEIYGWFTEGFDTKDLQEAKALLQELA